MHKCAKSLLFRLIAGCVELLLRKRHFSALANGFRSKDLDYVRTSFLLLAHELSDFFRRAGLLTFPYERLQGSEDTRTGQQSLCDSVTQRNIIGRSYTTGILSVLAEYPGDVHVCVNPARQHCETVEIVVHRTCGLRFYRHDLRSLDHDANVVQSVALAVQERARADDDALTLCRCRWGKGRHQPASYDHAEYP